MSRPLGRPPYRAPGVLSEGAASEAVPSPAAPAPRARAPARGLRRSYMDSYQDFIGFPKILPGFPKMPWNVAWILQCFLILDLR